MGELRRHVARAVVVAAVLATGIACTGPVRAAATAAGTVSSRGAPAVSSPRQPCSNPSDSVLAIRVATSTLERVIKVGRGAFPDAIAITPNGKTAYVTLASNDEVLPVSTAANKPGRAVKVGVFPDALAITPNGRTVYVANDGSDTVTPISTAANKPGRAVKVGVSPGVIGITPNGRTVYVGNGLVEQLPSRTPLNAVVPISTATDSAGRVLLVAAGTKHPGSADAFAFSRDSKTAYVAVAGTDEVDPIRVAGGTLGRAIQAGTDPGPVVITPNGKTAYVADLGSDTVTPVSTATGRPGKAITVGAKLGPQATTAAIALTPNGKTLYVATNSNAAAVDDTVTPVSTATNRPGKAIRVGSGIDAIAITPNGKTAYAASFNAGRVTPIRIATNTAGKPIAVGTDVGPITMAITPNSATVYVADVATCASAEPPGDPSAAEEPGHASYWSPLTSGSSAAAAAASRRSTCPAALARAAASPSRECTGETASA